MLKNIVFDLGGVFVDYDPREYLSDRFLNKPLEDFLYDRIFGSTAWRELDAGTITLSRATEQMLAACGPRRYEGQLVLDDWRDMLTTRRGTVRLAEELRALGLPLYYLSDIPEDVLDMFRRKKSFMRLFVGGAASCEEKLVKPDLVIYRRLLERYHLNPSETVFIDDTRENVMAAEELGMTAILFRNEKDLRKTLQFLGIPLANQTSRRSHLHGSRPTKNAKKKPVPEIKAVMKLTDETPNHAPKEAATPDIPLE